MKLEEYKVDLETQTFTYDELNDEKYKLDVAIKYDKEAILREAKESHGEMFEETYDVDSLKPYKINVYSVDGKPVLGMIIYIIAYKGVDSYRQACGNYHLFWNDSLMPHPYAGSVCW